MLQAVNRKAAYWLLAALTALFLFSTPYVVPAAHADCSASSATICPG